MQSAGTRWNRVADVSNKLNPTLAGSLAPSWIKTNNTIQYRGAQSYRCRRCLVTAQAGDRRPSRRLIPFVLSTPRRFEEYFNRYPLRKAVWSAIAGAAGFYAGNTVTLSFGALAVNDILAAVITLVFYEVVSNAFYSSANPPLRLWFLNFFKIGFVAALMADAVKLGA